MSETHDYFLSAEAARERARTQGRREPGDPLTKEEERKAWYGPEDAEPKEREGDNDEEG
jgi:hypothetical protein